MAAAAYPAIANLVHELSTSTGSGNLTTTTVNGKQTFNTAFGNGATTDVFYYFISNRDVATEYEWGTGHLSAATTLVRDTIIGGSNGTSAQNFSAGTKDIVCDIPSGFQTARLQKYGLTNHSLAVSASASALTISLKDSLGNDPTVSSPVLGWFRNATGTTGSLTPLLITSALSLVVSSGSTLGVSSTTAFRLWVVLFNDGGTARLGVVNCLVGGTTPTAIFPLVENVPASSTAEGGAGAADSAGVIYTGSAVTSKAYLIVGYIEWDATGLTAGTWTTTHVNFIQSFGYGINKPGTVIQAVFARTTSLFLTTNTTYTDVTGATVSLSPSSAANPIRFTQSGSLFVDATATNTAYLKLLRASTSLGSTLMNAAGGGQTPSCSIVLDAPQTTSSTAYKLQLRNSTAPAGLGAGWGNGDSGVTPWGYVQVEELMA